MGKRQRDLDDIETFTPADRHRVQSIHDSNAIDHVKAACSRNNHKPSNFNDRLHTAYCICGEYEWTAKHVGS